MSSDSILTALVSVILGGGFVGGIVALVKLKPEGDQILVSSAKDVVLIQRDALEELRTQMAELERRLSEQLEAAGVARAQAEKARAAAEAALAEANHEKRHLLDRVAALEGEVAELRELSNGGHS